MRHLHGDVSGQGWGAVAWTGMGRHPGRGGEAQADPGGPEAGHQTIFKFFYSNPDHHLEK